MINSAYTYILSKLTTAGITNFTDNIPSDNINNAVAVRLTNAEPQYRLNGVISYITNTFNVYIRGNESNYDTCVFAESVQNALNDADNKLLILSAPVYAYTTEKNDIVLLMTVLLIN